ncbi:enoyl-CoA hydratase/isomerase family protein [Rhodococcus sp. NPDC127528]|uniref:enoyl-CoA hydratase/isomerase family protein n=1 Tax=unclassified Rhodococcus (in: high G+C Gram-positive bacteria) TaxID=192944 RepID=UPI00362B2979
MTSLDGLSRVSLEGDVLRIVIATADNGTSLDFDGVDQGIKALHALSDGTLAARSVLLIGEGANFCAGGNVRAFAGAENRAEFVGAVAGTLHEFVRAIEATEVPIVAAVQGWAAGAGMSLVCTADIAIGGPSTKLRPAYPSIGYTPDGGMSWTLPRIVGVARAREILLTDAVLGADEAVRLGVLSRLVGDDEVKDEALRVARTLAAGPTSAYAGIKRLLAGSGAATLSEQLDAETASISAAAVSVAGREGVDAFVGKRRADFATNR